MSPWLPNLEWQLSGCHSNSGSGQTWLHMNYHMYVCLNIHVVYEGDKKAEAGFAMIY